MIPPKLRSRDDRGFTLIEVVLTITILGIIILPLGNFLLGYLKTYQQTSNRVSDSHDVQIATAYFSQDVGDIGVHAATSPYALQQSVWRAPTGTYCGSTAGTTVLLMSWDAWTVGQSGGVSTGTASTSSVTYANASGVLHRIYCAAGSTVTSDAVLVHGLQSATVTCDTTCESATPPRTIKLSLSIATGSTDQAATTIALSGQRRQS